MGSCQISTLHEIAPCMDLIDSSIRTADGTCG